MLKGGKTAEQIKGLSALFEEREERIVTVRTSNKHNKAERELDIAYKEATMRPADLYRTRGAGRTKTITPNWRKTGEVTEVKRVKGKRVIKIAIPKPTRVVK